MGNGRKPDRRIQRTRQLLRDALLSLIAANSYEAVTVQNIADYANISRSTFYLHFKDKNDLLFSSLREMYDEINARSSPISREELIAKGFTPELLDASDWEHVGQYAAFYKTMLSEKGSAAFIVSVMDYLALVYRQMIEEIRLPEDKAPLPPDLVSYILAGAHVGATQWWLENNMPFTPAEVVSMSYFLFVRGLWWSVGIDTAIPDYPMKEQGKPKT